MAGQKPQDDDQQGADDDGARGKEGLQPVVAQGASQGSQSVDVLAQDVRTMAAI